MPPLSRWSMAGLLNFDWAWGWPSPVGFQTDWDLDSHSLLTSLFQLKCPWLFGSGSPNK